MKMFRKREVERLLNSHGQNATLTYGATEATYNPATGKMEGGTTSSKTVLCYFFNYSLDEMNGNQITLGDRKVLVSTVDTSGDPIPEPKSTDTFNGVGDKVSISRVEKIYSKDQVMCYICHVSE